MKVRILKGVLKGKLVDLIGISYGLGCTIKSFKGTTPQAILAEARSNSCHLAVVDTSKELRVSKKIMYYLFANIEFPTEVIPMSESVIKNSKKKFFITSDCDGDCSESFNSIEEAIEHITSEVEGEGGDYEAYISVPILKIVCRKGVDITEVN
jgi:hypothetical protein